METAEAQRIEQKDYVIADPNLGISYLDDAIQRYRNGEIKHCVLDFETSHDMRPWLGGSIIMVCLAHDFLDHGVAIPLEIQNVVHHEGFEKYVDEIDFEVSERQKRKILKKTSDLASEVPLSGHNLKYDLKWACYNRLVKYGQFRFFDDTLNSISLIQPFKKKGDHKLEKLCERYLGVEDWGYIIRQYRDKFRYKKDRHYGNIPTGLLAPYGARDAYNNLKLSDKLRFYIDEYKQHHLVSILNRVAEIFVEVETKGCVLDEDYLKYLSDQYDQEMQSLLERIRSLSIVQKYINERLPALKEKNNSPRKKKKKSEQQLIADAFNINSTPQLREIIYGKEYFDFSPHEDFKTKNGEPQTSREALEYFYRTKLDNELIVKKKHDKSYWIKHTVTEELREQKRQELQKELKQVTEAREFIDCYLRYKKFHKFKTTYIERLKNSQNSVYRENFALTSTVTGRLSSGFHTIPKENEADIKRCVVSRWKKSGGLILSADQSQIEVRIAAALSQEPKLLKAYEEGYDIHTVTATQCFKKNFDEVTAKERKNAKIVTFGILYGKQYQSLAKELNIPEEEAKSMINNFFYSNSYLSEWVKRQQHMVKRNNMVVTPWGRRIPINAEELSKIYDSDKPNRLAVNYPIQSTANDLQLEALVNIDARFKKEGLKSHLIGNVHDSLHWDIYPQEFPQVLNIVYEESVYNVRERNPWIICPLEISVEPGVSLGAGCESEILERSNNHIKMKSQGLRHDLKNLILDAKKVYQTEANLLDSQPLSDADFGNEIFSRSYHQDECELTLSV